MSPNTPHTSAARLLAVAVLASSLAACATYDDDFARVNSRLDQLDARVQGAAQSAESANRRLDQLEGRVQQIERAPGRRPRG